MKKDKNEDEKKIAEIEKELPEIIKRVKKIEKPEREVGLSEWKDTIQNNFPELIFPAELCLSIVAQIIINDISNPFALVLVDMPSSGKTTVINFFSEINELTYATDKFTPASFVSNAANVSAENLKKIDLLPRLRYKTLLLRDLATLFSKREDDLTECLGLLTRALDGEGINTDSGTHGQRKYEGEYLFMLLAASTPIPSKVWKTVGNLGSRLFFFNMNIKEKSEIELANQLVHNTYKYKESQCRLITKDFLSTIWSENPEGIDWDRSKENEENMRIIARCARLLAKLRGVVSTSVDKSQDSNKPEYGTPVIEKPDRINQLLYNFARGHAVISGRRSVANDDLRFIIEIAIDSAPLMRTIILRKILLCSGILKTTDVTEEINRSTPTAHKEMEVLKILGVCDIKQESYGIPGEPEKEIFLKKEFEWFLSDECKKIRGLSINHDSDSPSLLL